MAKLLITGATGFLGRHLVKRMLCSGQHDILAVARNEGKLMELRAEFPSIDIFTGDVSNIDVCRQVVRGVDGVYALHGFKHVGWAEKQPLQCIESNILGNLELLSAVSLYKTPFIVGISTDKAAQIAGVYGASKFLMEALYKQFEGFNPETKFRTVRYGNVLYSTGSVLCKWKELLQQNKPITITEPNATRFYWTVDQAIDLVFECLQKATDSTPYTPKMKAIKLGDLMECMIMKYGDGVYRVEQIGLQNGENLHETMDGRLFSNGAVKYTTAEIMEMI
jgi:UDP-N-acetylglucosamine 4,6-dehydratase/5-epimerase